MHLRRRAADLLPNRDDIWVLQQVCLGVPQWPVRHARDALPTRRARNEGFKSQE